jgi:hypothetical protein
MSTEYWLEYTRNIDLQQTGISRIIKLMLSYDSYLEDHIRTGPY